MINIVVEGPSDREMARAIVKAAGHTVGQIVAKGGKAQLDPLLSNYNRAARHGCWVIFRDSDTQCPVGLRQRLLRGIDNLSPTFSLRIAHPMSEAWLLADYKGFARYFRVKPAKVPRDVEALADAKRAVLNLCATSGSRAIRQGMVVDQNRTGPLYVATINQFAATTWNVHSATEHSSSLLRAVERLQDLPGD